ncbi:cytochrome P450 2F2-like [Gastrophryne carolinensis]
MIEFLNITGWLVGFITFTVFLSYGKLLWRRSKMPPGPFPLPVLGNFLQIHSEGLLPALLKMSQKYGPVYTVHFGSRPTVVVTGYEALKEVLIDDTDAFINRGSLPAFDLIFKCDEYLSEALRQLNDPATYVRLNSNPLDKFQLDLREILEDGLALGVLSREEVDALELYGRYIDDLIFIWKGGEDSIKSFVDYLNNNSLNLEFTFEYNPCTISFLDLTIGVNQDTGTLYTKTYRKDTAGNMTLRADSCHPPHTIRAIPLGEMVRARRNCSEQAAFDMELDVISDRLLNRGYSPNVLERAKNLASGRDRKHMLDKSMYANGNDHGKLKDKRHRDMAQKKNDKITLVTTYSEEFNKIKQIINKHLPILNCDPQLKEVLKHGTSGKQFICRCKECLGMFEYPLSLTFMNGEMWKQLRQFSFWTLRDLGMGKKSLEEPILDEAHHFVEHFKGLNGKPVDPKYILVCAISNILANLLMGIRYEYEDKNWMNVLQLSNEGYHILSSVWGQLYDIFPAIFHYLPGPHRKMYDLVKPLSNIFTESVKTHLDTLDPACPRDYMDCFLVKMKQEEKNNSKTPFTPRHLAMSTYSMFLGGTESAAGTTYFGLLFLIKYPELQGRLHEEIDQVIGQTREPKAEDRNLMPFMNAFVHEIQRFSDIFPMGFMRATTRDTKLRGFFIFKDTNVMPMLTTALRDPTMFETPEEFNVNHFLDENGKFKKNNAFIPFSAGKRVCIAEGLVRMQLFLFFTIILQNFTLKSEVDPKNLDVSPKESGFENLPPACKIIFTPNKLEGRV